MPDVTANGIRIEYDTFGDDSHPALLLIAGNGAQTIFWDAEFCGLLVKKGFFVIRFDNRDAGLSTKFEEAGIPDFPAAIKALMESKTVETAYSLDDMADDAACLRCFDGRHDSPGYLIPAFEASPEPCFHNVDHGKP